MVRSKNEMIHRVGPALKDLPVQSRSDDTAVHISACRADNRWTVARRRLPETGSLQVGMSPATSKIQQSSLTEGILPGGSLQGALHGTLELLGGETGRKTEPASREQEDKQGAS